MPDVLGESLIYAEPNDEACRGVERQVALTDSQAEVWSGGMIRMMSLAFRRIRSGGRMIEMACGPIQYTESGKGAPMPAFSKAGTLALVRLASDLWRVLLCLRSPDRIAQE
jgi:hypothetical protein